jgi:hypothetical protein
MHCDIARGRLDLQNVVDNASLISDGTYFHCKLKIDNNCHQLCVIDFSLKVFCLPNPFNVEIIFLYRHHYKDVIKFSAVHKRTLHSKHTQINHRNYVYLLRI